MTIITPQPISGFPEFLPNEQLEFQRKMRLVQQHYESFGFVPIETPAVERTEVLTAKGGDDKEIYALRRLTAQDDAAKDLALRFDLTVPFARYVAQHSSKLTFPFRRYQIQPVWRGERAQSGRYRQFYQCDIDVIDENELSLYHDAEMPAIIYQIFQDMKIGPFTIRLNNRKILQGFLRSLGLKSSDAIEGALRIIDRLEKVGRRQTEDDLAQMGLPAEAINNLIDFFQMNLPTDAMLAKMKSMADGNNSLFSLGVKELEEVVNAARDLGVPDTHFRVDPSIARGLNYYTGTIYETTLNEHPGIGSICSGGRYDNLANHFIDKKLPGVGISIGLTRLIPRLLKAGVLEAVSAATAPVLVTRLDKSRQSDYLQIGTTFRKSGINAEVFLQDKKLGAQLHYANRKGVSIAIIAGDEEFSKNNVIVKDLASGTQTTVSTAEMVDVVKNILGPKH